MTFDLLYLVVVLSLEWNYQQLGTCEPNDQGLHNFSKVPQVLKLEPSLMNYQDKEPISSIVVSLYHRIVQLRETLQLI